MTWVRRMRVPQRPATAHRVRSAVRLLPLTVLAVSGAACRGSAPPLPRLEGELVHVVVEAALAGDDGAAAPPVAVLVLDSLAFPRLGSAARGTPYDPAEIRRQVGRPATLVEPTDVLTCPRRQPCSVRDDAVYLTVWEAVPVPGGLELVVSRTFNVHGMYPLTRSVVHRLRLAGAGNGRWRLTSRQQQPT
jgi:hypothetical protein